MLKCNKCNGSGIIYYKYQDGDHEHELNDVCDECEGTGVCNKSIYQRALNLWGYEAQLNMAIEELGELIVKLAKLRRLVNGSNEDDVASEIADVEIMMAQLRLMIGNELVEKAKRKKLVRLEERVKYGEGST